HTPLHFWPSFLGYAERRLPAVHTALTAALARPDNLQLLVQSALRTPLHFWPTLLGYAEGKLPAVHTALTAALARPDNLQLLVQSAVRTPLYFWPSFVPYATQRLPALIGALSEPEHIKTLAQVAVVSRPMDVIGFLDQVSF